MKEKIHSECVIIGGGIIGLAIAAKLAKQGLVVILLEAEKQTIQHASSHNSEVIHSGIYYKSGSLKAKLCVEGNKLLYSYCQKNNIPRVTGDVLSEIRKKMPTPKIFGKR